MKVYIDDMLEKSIKATDHINDLQEAFDALKWHRMKLNSSKYAFGISFGKFLNFLITNRGIEANSEKIKIIIDMRHLTSKKEVQ